MLGHPREGILLEKIQQGKATEPKTSAGCVAKGVKKRSQGELLLGFFLL